MFNIDPPPFLADALCAQTDPEVFFPEQGASSRPAKRVCMACSARVACLEWSVATGQRYGVWGGLSERERQKWKRERRGLAS